MRLTSQSQMIITQAAEEIFGSRVAVKLFGSRLDDSAAGGDIDILIESEQQIEQSGRKSLQLIARLQMRLGDQPIDVVVIDPQTQLQSFHDEVLRTAVSL